MSAKEPVNSQSIEEKVEKWVESIEPDAVFAHELRARVLEKAVLKAQENTRRGTPVPRMRFYNAWRWSLALAGMALLVAFLVFSIGLLPRSSLSPAGVPTSTVNLLSVSPTPDTSTVAPDETGQSEKQTPQGDQAQRYVVQEGDTWTGIASTFSLTTEELRSLNGMSEGAVLYVGQELVVSRPREAVRSNATPPSPYVVQEGDTWAGIASTFGLTTEELLSLNGMSEGAVLYAGQKLQVGRTGQADQPHVTPIPLSVPPIGGVPDVLVPGACDIPVSRLSDPQMLPFQSLQGLVDGGTVESGAFTMELWLACDPSFRRAKISGDQFSEIDGLGILSLWHYHGQDMDGYINEFAGVEPYVMEVGGTGPVRNNPSGTVLKGLQFPAGIIPDFSQADYTLRYVFKTRTPDGVLSGAALSFTLQRQADGYRPVGIRLQALSESELQTVEGKPDVSAPFATRDPYTLYPQLQEVHDLLTRWQTPLRATPGWVHRLTRVHDESSNDLYAGLKDYTRDEWFQVDERGYVSALATNDLALDGRILQQSYSIEGKSVNLTFGGSGSFQPFYFDLGANLEKDLLNELRAGKSIDRSEELLDGKQVWTFSFGETYQEAVLIENDVLASAIFRREVLDPESGALLLSENVLVTPDGQEQIRKRWTYESVERVDQPPERLLELFGQDFGGYRPAASLGTPPPPDFDPARSALRLFSIPGDDFNLPTFWYGDIYAGNYLLGRVDFGGSPGGYCDRSADGSRLAFNKVVFAGENEAREYLRWLDLRDVSQVYDPAPELELVSKVAWAPQGARLAFSACQVGRMDCGLYLLDTDTNEVRLLSTAGVGALAPVWKPDGTQLAFIRSDVDQEYTMWIKSILCW
jgi:LysM repeat protein